METTAELIIRKYFRQRHVIAPPARKMLDAARKSRKLERKNRHVAV